MFQLMAWIAKSELKQGENSLEILDLAIWQSLSNFSGLPDIPLGSYHR
jgi:hypothetical protein